MITIASLVDPTTSAQIREIWDLLENDCGLREVKLTPYPHVSWQGADNYDLKKIEGVCQSIANAYRPFWIHTSGIGIFTGPNPTLAINISRNTIITEIHQEFWESCEILGQNVNPFHHPDYWMPHITLANKDITRQNISCAVEKLAFLEFKCEVYIDNFAVLYKYDQQVGVQNIYSLRNSMN